MTSIIVVVIITGMMICYRFRCPHLCVGRDLFTSIMFSCCVCIYIYCRAARHHVEVVGGILGHRSGTNGCGVTNDNGNECSLDDNVSLYHCTYPLLSCSSLYIVKGIWPPCFSLSYIHIISTHSQHPIAP